MTTERIRLKFDADPTWLSREKIDQTISFYGKLDSAAKALVPQKVGDEVERLVQAGAPKIIAGVSAPIFGDAAGLGGEIKISATGTEAALTDWVDSGRLDGAVQTAVDHAYDEIG